MEYFLHILILIGIYIILAESLNLIMGYTGILSIAHAAFYGIGAYTAAIMALKMNSPFIINLLVAIGISGVFGGLIGIPSLRIKGHYFVITTFAFQIIIFNVLNNFVKLTGGPVGIPGIPNPKILNWKITSHFDFLLLILFFVSIVLFISHKIVNSPFGRVLKAIREDEVLTSSLGKNVSFFKVAIFIIGSGMAAISGVLYAYYVSYIDPSSFTIMESIFIISIVIIGGVGTLLGPVVGTAILVIMPEIFRALGLPNSVAANFQQILYGMLLVSFMMYRPKGINGKFSYCAGNK